MGLLGCGGVGGLLVRGSRQRADGAGEKRRMLMMLLKEVLMMLLKILYSLFSILYSLFALVRGRYFSPHLLISSSPEAPHLLISSLPHLRKLLCTIRSPAQEAPCHNPYWASTFRKVAQASTALSAKLANSKNRFSSLRNKFLSTSKASRFKFAGVTMVSNKVAYSFPG